MKYNILSLTFFCIIVIIACNSCNSQHKSFRNNQPGMNSANESKDLIQNKKNRREELYRLLGKLPERKRAISVKVLSREETDEMIVEKLLFDINGQESVPAYFTRPKNSKGKIPVILFNHSHFGQYEVGKEEFIKGRKEMQKPPYALALARAGYAGLCLDSWGFGERR